MPKPIDTAKDVGNILLQALDELKAIRSALATPGDGAADSRAAEAKRLEMEAILARAEGELTAKAEQVSDMLTSYAQLDEEEEEEGSSSSRIRTRRPTQTGGQSGKMTQRAAFTSQDPLAAHKQSLVKNPTSELARTYLRERYGLAPPPSRANEPNARAVGRKVTGQVMKKKISKPGLIAPKEFRENPHDYAPPPISTEDVRRGMLDLINRGVIPKAMGRDSMLEQFLLPLTAEAASITTKAEAHAQRPVQPPGIAALNTGTLKLDVLGSTNVAPLRPVAAPSQPTMTQVDMSEQSNLAAARGYQQLLDAFSLHEFVIRHGVVLDSTPEFASYKRTYARVWPQIESLIRHLEEVCTTFNVDRAVIDGKALAEIAEEAEDDVNAEVGMDDLLSCIQNIDEVAAQLEKYDEEGQLLVRLSPDEAATIIQKYWRGYSRRQECRNMIMLVRLVKKIQRFWRAYRKRQQTLAAISVVLEKRQNKFKKLQQKLEAEWNDLQQRPRFVIHIPSFTLPQKHRLSIPDFQLEENSQMARLLELDDPNLNIIYVCPFPLDKDLETYYHKLLSTRNIENIHLRYRIVYPENYKRLPYHLSLTQMLLCSPKAMARIQACVEGFPAYIVPHMVGTDDMYLSALLDIPIFGPAPELYKQLSSKTMLKTILKEAEVNMAPSMEDIRSEDDLVARLANMIVDMPKVPRWIFKVDDEFFGRGHAYFDIASTHNIAVVTSTVNKAPANFRRGSKERKDAVDAVTIALRVSLPKKTVMVHPSLYPSWRYFRDTMMRRGCIVEACPTMVTGSPSVNLLVEPNGGMRVLNTHEQIFCTAYRFVGASFPQSSVPHAALAAASLAIATACRRRGFWGYLGIDFVALKEAGMLRLWAVDLNPRYTLTQASFQMFHFMCGGSFDSSTSLYLIPNTRKGSVVEDDSNEEELPPSSPLAAQVAAKAKASQKKQRRFYVAATHISHPNICNLQYASFFNQCRLEGIVFDMHDKVGTSYNFMDSLSCGMLGALCMGRSPVEAFRLLATALDFIARQVALGTISDDAYEANSTLRGVRSTIRFLADKLSGK
eukprot:jgi/Mesvir1/17879/Mv12955-RA.1